MIPTDTRIGTRVRRVMDGKVGTIIRTRYGAQQSYHFGVRLDDDDDKTLDVFWWGTPEAWDLVVEESTPAPPYDRPYANPPGRCESHEGLHSFRNDPDPCIGYYSRQADQRTTGAELARLMLEALRAESEAAYQRGLFVGGKRTTYPTEQVETANEAAVAMWAAFYDRES